MGQNQKLKADEIQLGIKSKTFKNFLENIIISNFISDFENIIFHSNFESVHLAQYSNPTIPIRLTNNYLTQHKGGILCNNF